MRTILLSLATLVGVGASVAGSTQTAGSYLQTCLAPASDYSPVYPTSALPVTSPELDAVFRLAKGEHYTKYSGPKVR